jgi:hypothetical protein
MREGCISLGDIKCDGCNRIIPCSERYLAIEEKQGVISRYCTECCFGKGYAHYKHEKGERVLTFLIEQA